MSQKEIQIRTLSSLAKVFPDRIVGKTCRHGEAARGQELSFQVAYRYFAPRYKQRTYRVEIISPLREYITLYRVGNVPADLVAYPERNDGNYISKKAGLFPDPLYPLEDGSVSVAMGLWRALWVSVEIPESVAAGEYPVKVLFYGEDDAVAAACTYRIKVHAALLPEATLLYTQWFHCDCIADVHGVKIFSEEHWRLIGDYMRLAAKHGMNMILTPVVTPPLDTAVGGERPLVRAQQGDRYSRSQRAGRSIFPTKSPTPCGREPTIPSPAHGLLRVATARRALPLRTHMRL